MEERIKKYTIETHFYDKYESKTFDSEKEWKEEIDSTANADMGTQGRGQYFIAREYEVEKGGTEEDYIEIAYHKIDYFTISGVWAEIDEEGKRTYLADKYDKKPHPENDGQVILAYMDEDEIHLTEEEAIKVNEPSQYMV